VVIWKFVNKNVALSEQTIREQIVAPSKLKHKEKNVAPLELRIDESSNLCGLQLTMMIICNSNGEIIFNID